MKTAKIAVNCTAQTNGKCIVEYPSYILNERIVFEQHTSFLAKIGALIPDWIVWYFLFFIFAPATIHQKVLANNLGDENFVDNNQILFITCHYAHERQLHTC